MEGLACRLAAALRVEHAFECSRLEKQLLARAYEQLVPVAKRRCWRRPVGPREGSPRLGSGKRLVATGG